MTCTFFIRQMEGIAQAFFTQAEQTVQEGPECGSAPADSETEIRYSDCAGASICIDGELQEGLATDENGRVTLPALAPRDTPYFITAKETKLARWGRI